MNIELTDDFTLRTNDERKLVEYLLKNYDNSIRPVRNASHPVMIRLGITLTQIFDLVIKVSLFMILQIFYIQMKFNKIQLKTINHFVRIKPRQHYF